MRAMKDSGIEWIGEIPESWSINKTLRIFKVIGSGTTPKSGYEEYYNGNIHWIQSGDINGGIIQETKVRVTQYAIENIAALKVYEKPFIIMAMYGASIGNISVAAIDGCVNQACCVFKDSNIDFNFSFYCLRAAKFFLVWNAVGGGQPNISQETLKQLWLPIPSLPEQQAISTYLDNQCAHIDNIIEKTKASIEEYKKLRQAVITQAVTKGVRGERAMKDTGFDWLLQIPDDWTMERGKNLFFETNNRSDSGEEELLTVSQYTGVTPRSQKNVNMFEAETLEGYKICEIGDIAANTMWLWAGAIGVSEYYGVISPSYNIYRQGKDAYNSKYLDYLLRIPPIVQLFASLSTGIRASRLRLYPEQFLNIYYPLPPLDEQAEIVAYLQEKIVEVDKLITKKEQFLTELESYKKSMIYEYVTGKKEVPSA